MINKKNIIQIIFLTIAWLFLATPVWADNETPECPANGNPTEILIFFHGCLCNNCDTQNCAGKALNLSSSANDFTNQLAIIRQSRPGVIGVFVDPNGASGGNWGNVNVSAIINSAKQTCAANNNSLQITLAGHSAGGKPVVTNAALANRVIFLDALYWDANAIDCSKISVIGGPSTKTQTDKLIARCQGQQGFYAITNYDGKINHNATRLQLAAFYTQAVVGSAPGNTAVDNSAVISKKMPKIINPFDNLQVQIPGLVTNTSQAICTSTDGINVSCQLPWIRDYVIGLFNYGTKIIGILAAIVLMIGGVIWLTAGGNKGQVDEARNWIFASISGLVVMLCSYLILTLLNGDLVNFKPLNLAAVPDESNIENESQAFGQSDKIACPTGVTNVNNLAYYFINNQPLIYSQAMRGSCNNQGCFCDCSYFANLLRRCANLPVLPGEGTTRGLVTSNRGALTEITADMCDSDPDTLMKPGDALVWNNGSFGHVLTYMGNQKVVECGGGNHSGEEPQQSKGSAVRISAWAAKCRGYFSVNRTSKNHAPAYILHR